MEFPGDRRYTTDDVWVRLEDGGLVTVGITDYAQDQLGEVVYLDLPPVGRRLATGEAFGVVESVKAVSDLVAPLAGEVVARNDALTQAPQALNASPYDEGWMLRVRLDDAADVDALLSAEAYRAQLPAD